MSFAASLQLWPLRVGWILLALIAGGPVGDALDGRSGVVVVVALVLAWGGWAGALAAMLLPRTLSLTAVRIIAPMGFAAMVAAVVAGSTTDGWDVAALSVGAVVLLLALAPWTTAAFVDGSSYGSERRIPLRTPSPIALLAVLTWAALAAGLVAGPLLLASGTWVVGAIATIVGAGIVWAGARSIHQLSRRWLVLVPTGLVLHDPLTMPDAQLFLRQSMALLGPADAEAPAGFVTEDLTAGASGLAMALETTEPVELLVHAGPNEAETRSVDRVLFTPSLPKEFLDAAAEKRLPVA